MEYLSRSFLGWLKNLFSTTADLQKLKLENENATNGITREMIEVCTYHALKFPFIWMDSWLSSAENFDRSLVWIRQQPVCNNSRYLERQHHDLV